MSQDLELSLAVGAKEPVRKTSVVRALSLAQAGAVRSIVV